MKSKAMECEEVQNLMPLHVGGDLESAQTQHMAQHLAGCSACRQALEAGQTLVGLRRAFWQAETSKVPDVWAALEGRLQVAAPAAAVPSMWAHRWIPMAAAAALVATFSIAFWPDRGPRVDPHLPSVAHESRPVLIHVGPQAVVGSEPVAEVSEALVPASQASSGLRRMAPQEPSLIERARPWGLEESPSRLRFEQGPMRVAGGN